MQYRLQDRLPGYPRGSNNGLARMPTGAGEGAAGVGRFFHRLDTVGGRAHIYYSFSVKDGVDPEEVAKAIAAYLQNDAHAIQSRMPYSSRSRSYWATILAGMRGFPLGAAQPEEFDEAQIQALLHAITESPERYPARSEGTIEGKW